MVASAEPETRAEPRAAGQAPAAQQAEKQSLPLLPPDTRRLGGEFDVRESGRRVVRYQVAEFHVMRLLAGWLAKIPEFDLKFEIGRHVWQDAQHAESLRLRTAELRIPADADRRLPVEVQRFLDALDEAETPLQFLVGVYRVAKPRLISAMQYHMAVTDQVCDAPTIRALRPIVEEEAEQIRWGEAAIEALIGGDPARAEQAAAWQRRLETILAEAGGLVAMGAPQPPEEPLTPEVAMQGRDGVIVLEGGVTPPLLPAAKPPRSERLLIAARDARFYIDMTPRVLPEDDEPPELLELEAALAARRRRSDSPAETEQRPTEGDRGIPPPVRLAQRDERFDMVHPADQARRMRGGPALSPGREEDVRVGERAERVWLQADWVEKSRRLMHAMMDNEMHAAELSGRNTYEFPRMPWEFHLDMARVVWDEIRHSEETRKHLEDLGGHVGMYPVVPGNFGYRIQLDLLHRLQDLHRRGELGGLNGLLKSRNAFREAGDEVGAKMFDFIQADETRHVLFGNRWVKWLLEDDNEKLRALTEENERLRQAHDKKVGALVRQALGDTVQQQPASGAAAAKKDDPTPVNVISLKIAGFTDEEIAELVQKGGGNAALE